MKVLLVVAILWVWWGVIMIVPTLGYNTVTLDLEDPETYSIFMNSLRTELASGQVECQIPVIRKTATVAQRFVLVDLKVSAEKIVTLGIDVTSVYVVAYRDKYQGKDRANFLKDASQVAKDNLFKGATVRNIPFGGSYGDLENAAKQTRANIELGLFTLQSAVESVFGKVPTGQIEAKFFIIAIQMVSEAARFKYIQNIVVARPYGTFKPDPKVLSLENNWGKISANIHKSYVSSPQCVDISPPIQLTDANNQVWQVSKVSQISFDMGLLLNSVGSVRASYSADINSAALLHDHTQSSSFLTYYLN